MSDPETAAGGEDLQFDHVVTDSASTDRDAAVAVVCSACQESITKEYYEVNGHPVCPRCRVAIVAAAETPQGIAPFMTAAVCGLGAGVAGAFIYFAVIFFAKLEIGIVAVLIGYMVGYTVRKGAGGGGLRFQVLAVALTYGSVALAYTPLVVMSAVNAGRAAQTAASAASPAATASAPAQEPRPRNPVVGVALLLSFIASLPLLVVWGSMPSGVISAFIILIGMRQAWRMTGTPPISVFGPYEIGTASLSESV